MPEISKDAQQVLSGVDEATRNAVLAQTQGRVLTSGEAKRALASLSVQNVMSPQNVTQTIQNPVQPVDYSDPLKIRERLNTELGVTDVERQYNEAVANLRNFDLGTTNQQFNIQQELNPMGVIRGEQETALGQRSLSRQGLAASAQTIADQLNAITAERNRREDILNRQREQIQSLMVQTPGAGINYTDTVESAVAKIDAYNIRMQKEADVKAEKALKSEEKKALKDQLRQLGIKTSGSTKDLEKRLRKYIKEANLSKAEEAALDRALKIKALNKPYYKPEKEKEAKPITWNATNTRQAARELIDEAEQNGLYGYDAWQYAAEQAYNLDIDTGTDSEFDKALKQRFGEI